MSSYVRQKWTLTVNNVLKYHLLKQIEKLQFKSAKKQTTKRSNVQLFTSRTIHRKRF